MDKQKTKARFNILMGILLVVRFVYVTHRFTPDISKVPEAEAKTGWSTDLDAALKRSEQSGKPVLVDFNATWCGPCEMYKEEVFNTKGFRELAQKFELVSIDIDEQGDLAASYGVEGIPDIRFIKKGKEVGKLVGYAGMELLADMNKALN